MSHQNKPQTYKHKPEAKCNCACECCPGAGKGDNCDCGGDCGCCETKPNDKVTGDPPHDCCCGEPCAC